MHWPLLQISPIVHWLLFLHTWQTPVTQTWFPGQFELVMHWQTPLMQTKKFGHWISFWHCRTKSGINVHGFYCFRFYLQKILNLCEVSYIVIHITLVYVLTYPWMPLVWLLKLKMVEHLLCATQVPLTHIWLLEQPQFTQVPLVCPAGMLHLRLFAHCPFWVHAPEISLLTSCNLFNTYYHNWDSKNFLDLIYMLTIHSRSSISAQSSNIIVTTSTVVHLVCEASSRAREENAISVTSVLVASISRCETPIIVDPSARCVWKKKNKW